MRAGVRHVWSVQDLREEFGKDIQGTRQEFKMQLALTDEIKDREVKQTLLIDDERIFSEELSQDFKLEAANAATGSPKGPQLPEIKQCRTEWPLCFQSEGTGHFRTDPPRIVWKGTD
jgi:hypothetical protein